MTASTLTKQKKPDNTSARGSRLEDMMTILEERVDKVIAKNEQVVKSYAQVVKDAAEAAFHTVTPQPMRGTTPAKVIIHNIPESEVQDLPGKNRDGIQSIQNLIENGLNIDRVEINTVIRLGG